MAAFTANVVFVGWGNNHRVAGDKMIFGLVAVLTFEVAAIGCHVNIDIAGRVGDGAVKVAMLNGISTTAEEVAVATVLS